MNELSFTYNSKTLIFKGKDNEKFLNICNEFSKSIKVDLNKLLFLYNGLQVNLNTTVYKLQNRIDRERKQMNIIVIEKPIQEVDITQDLKSFKELKEKINNILNNIEGHLSRINKDDNDYTINNISCSEDIKNILNSNNIVNQFSNIFNLYNKINRNPPNKNITEEINEITLKYKMNRNEPKIKILGTDFVKNNEQKCRIIFENSIYNLSDTFDYTNSGNETFEIKLTGLKDITNMSNLFQGCSSLINISENFSDINVSRITNMSGLFFECSSLKYLPDISNWDTSNVTDMSCMFYKCSSLCNLPDISKWKMNNVQSIKLMFYECASLKELPDISLWDTSNIIHMGCLFSKCVSLISLPDISKWNINNVNNIGILIILLI